MSTNTGLAHSIMQLTMADELICGVVNMLFCFLFFFFAVEAFVAMSRFFVWLAKCL